MAVDMFLNLDGISGEAQDQQHAGQIDVLSWSWGMSQSGTTHLGSGGGAGKVNVSDLNIMKYTDSSSPALMKYCCNGGHISSGTLYVRKAGGDSQVEYVKIELNEIMVTSYQQSGSAGGDDRLMESVSLNFAKYKTTYTQQNTDGTAGTSTDQGWDMSTNTDNS